MNKGIWRGCSDIEIIRRDQDNLMLYACDRTGIGIATSAYGLARARISDRKRAAR